MLAAADSCRKSEGLETVLSAYPCSGDEMKRTGIIIICFLTVALFLRPDQAGAAAGEALRLCAATVVPSLFPFLAVTALLLHLGLDSVLSPLCAHVMGPLFRLRGECAAPLLAGFLGGYPAGARAAGQLCAQGVLARREAERLLGFCNNCSPGFLIGFVGVGIFKSAAAGGWLLGIHILSALLSGMILCRIGRGGETPELPCRLPVERMTLSRALTASVSDALGAILQICAYVVLFRTATALLSPWIPEALTGVLEMVGGITALQGDRAGFVAAAALTAWGGVSVHCQSAAVVGELSMKWHTAGKLLQAVIAAVLAAGAVFFVR